MAEEPPPVEKRVEEVVIDPRLDPSVQRRVIEAEVRNARNGRMAGVIVIVLGVGLTLLGATGAVDMHLGGMGLDAKVTNAAPGVVAMVIGLVIVWRTNLRIDAARGGK
jgi:uncharacterized protein YjeT (DUF2065 family)